MEGFAEDDKAITRETIEKKMKDKGWDREDKGKEDVATSYVHLEKALSEKDKKIAELSGKVDVLMQSMNGKGRAESDEDLFEPEKSSTADIDRIVDTRVKQAVAEILDEITPLKKQVASDSVRSYKAHAVTEIGEIQDFMPEVDELLKSPVGEAFFADSDLSRKGNPWIRAYNYIRSNDIDHIKSEYYKRGIRAGYKKRLTEEDSATDVPASTRVNKPSDIEPEDRVNKGGRKGDFFDDVLAVDNM